MTQRYDACIPAFTDGRNRNWRACQCFQERTEDFCWISRREKFEYDELIKAEELSGITALYEQSKLPATRRMDKLNRLLIEMKSFYK